VRVVAFDFEKAGAAAELAVEFVHEEVNGLVKVFGGDGDDELGAGEDDVAFGDEFAGMVLGGGVFEFDAEAVEAGFVFEEALHLGVNDVFESVGEFEVDAGEDQVVVTHGQYVCGYGLTLRMIRIGQERLVHRSRKD